MAQIFFLTAQIAIITVLLIIFCEMFTNAVEYIGKYFKINDGVLGSILAAVGTALPETALPVIAVAGAYISGTDIKVGTDICKGAVLGSPFFLSTAEFFVMAFAVFVLSKTNKRSDKIKIDIEFFKRSLTFFLLAYGLGISALFIGNRAINIVCGIFLPIFYVFYALRTIKYEGDCEPENSGTSALHFEKIFHFNGGIAGFAQFSVSLAGIIAASHFFVETVKPLSIATGVPPMIITLFVAPFATELPETLNALLWIKKGKDTLAVGNITGSLIFQSCFPMSAALLLTDGLSSEASVLNVVCVLFSVAWLIFSTRKNTCELSFKTFLPPGIFYLAFLIYIISG